MTTALTVTRHLSVTLTSLEKQEKNEELVKTLNDLERLEENFVRLHEQHKANTTNRKLPIRELSHDLANGYVMRSIACEQLVDLEKNRMLIKRLDSGLEIEERALTAQEIHEARKKKP